MSRRMAGREGFKSVGELEKRFITAGLAIACTRDVMAVPDLPAWIMHKPRRLAAKSQREHPQLPPQWERMRCSLACGSAKSS